MTTAVAYYLEDFTPGQRFVGSTRYRFDRARAIEFAAEFDPQVFHVDERAAENTMFRGLVVSGWHTAAITMRLMVDSDFRPAGGILGAGIDELRWLRPVRPDDELHVEIEVIDTVAPQPNRQHGVLRVRTTTLNQREEPVMSSVASLRVLTRPSSASL